MRVQPFGSYANGLSLAESDIDVVITGILVPDDERGGRCMHGTQWLLIMDVSVFKKSTGFAGHGVLHVPICTLQPLPLFATCH